MFENNCEEFFDPRQVTLDPLPFTFDPRPYPRPFTLDPRLVTLDQKANSSLAYILHFVQEMNPERIFHYLNCNDRSYNNYWFWLFLRALICHIILSVKKFSILFGSLFAYLSCTWCVITWCSHPITTFWNWMRTPYPRLRIVQCRDKPSLCLVISNWPCTAPRSHFEVMHPVTPSISLYSIAKLTIFIPV